LSRRPDNLNFGALSSLRHHEDYVRQTDVDVWSRDPNSSISGFVMPTDLRHTLALRRKRRQQEKGSLVVIVLSNLTMMKAAILASLLTSAAAFVPAQQVCRTSFVTIFIIDLFLKENAVDFERIIFVNHPSRYSLSLCTL
jgi:hypothetical protein